MDLSSTRGLGLCGRLRLELHDAETGELVAVRETPNLIVTSGLNALAAAMNWAFVQNYNTSWGSPFASTSGDLADVYGAVGTGNAAVSASDTALSNEVSRSLITNGTNSSNVLTYQFFFGTAAANGTIQEMGVFTGATSQQVTTTAGLTQNQTYTSLSVSATVVSIPSGAVLIINYGGAQVGGIVQQVVTSGTTAVGATTINVSSFVATQSFPTGTIVSYTTGTLLDHALLSPAVVKTAAQTATLSFSMTLQSG